MRCQGTDGKEVVPATGKDDVGVPFRWLYELEVHGLDVGFVMFQGLLVASAPLFCIAANDPRQAVIGIRIHVNPQVHPLAQPDIGHDQDSLHDNDGLGKYGNGLFRPGTGNIIVDGHFNRLPRFQYFQVFDEEVELNRRRVVEIDFQLLLRGEVTIVLVIGVLGDDGYRIFWQPFDDLVDHG